MKETSTLLTFVTENEDGSSKINIYGNPSGLRDLANALIKQADVDQTDMTYLGDHDTDHTHYKASHVGGILSASSDELQLGRTDLRTGEMAYWAKDRIDTAGDTE
jgi:hypothetical protein